MEGLGEIQVELRSHDARLTANHDSIGNLRERTAEHATKIGVIATELRETRADISHMTAQVAANALETNKRLAAQSKSFAAAAATMATLSVSICGLVAVLLASHA